MKTKLLNLMVCFLTISVLLFYSCDKDNDDDDITPDTDMYDNGVLISNEGKFQDGTGTISFIDKSTNNIYNEIFLGKNGRPLGNIVNSITVINGKGYIVVNNAEKVEIVDMSDFSSIGVIEGLLYPRYLLGINENKGYLSVWANGSDAGIKVIDLNTNSVIGSVVTGKGAEKMLLSGNSVYIVNSGGYENDSTVTVIDASTDEIITKIVVGKNPNSIQNDIDGNIWVLCGGKWKSDWSGLEIPGRLVMIDPSTNSIEKSFEFTSLFSTPSKLVVNSSKDDLIYSYNGGIYTHDISASELDTIPIISRNVSGLAVDPSTGYVYVGEAGDYVSEGWVIRYEGSSGNVVDSFKAGIIPSNFWFN